MGRTGQQIGTATFKADTGAAIALGTLAPEHLGDVLCLTAVARAARVATGKPAKGFPSSIRRQVFANNADVGFTVTATRRQIRAAARGAGHIIQRLQRGLNLPVVDIPKPEIVLSQSELEWSLRERARWRTDKPVLVICMDAISNHAPLSVLNWPSVAARLASKFYLVQPRLTSPLAWDLRSSRHVSIPLAGATVYDDLPIRHFFALISSSDAYLGGSSGGSHVAAAFSKRAVVVLDPTVRHRLRFPVSAWHFPDCYLYPQHDFVSCAELNDADYLDRWADEWAAQVLSGQRREPHTGVVVSDRTTARFRARIRS